MSVTQSLSDKISGLLETGVVGLDVGASAIKICQLTKQGKSNYILKNFGYRPLAEGAFSDSGVEKMEDVVEALKESFKSAGMKGRQVCFGIGGQQVVLRKMKSPKGKRSEIEDQVAWEAEQFIPFGADNSVVGIHVLGPADKDNVNVIMAAGKLDYIQSCEETIKQAGLVPKILDLQFLALINIFEISYSELIQDLGKGTLLIDFGAQFTKIIVYKEGAPLLARSIALGGITVTEEIQKEIGLTFQEAEDLKLTRDEQGNFPEEIAPILARCREDIVKNIVDSISFYTTQSAQDKVYNCFITGGNLQLPGLIEELTTALNLTVEILDPLRKIKVKKKLPDDLLDQLTYIASVPIGLALRSFDIPIKDK
ncbi:MAG: type IV pilus assembly protein PilM [Bacteriovoracaceae bacterium]|nr:type IV pilus assembly protein PilM [Bacteriovoracaceae bacterium]